MRVLWATAHLPDPSLGGGWALEYEVLRYAAKQHDILVISGELAAGHAPPDVVSALDVEVRGVARESLPLPEGKVAVLRQLLRHRMPVGAWMVTPVVAALIDAVASAERERRFDLVHVMPQEAAPVAAASTAPSALYLGDSYWSQADRELRSAQSVKDRFRLTLERANARRWERRWYPRAGAVACVSRADADALTRLCGIAVDVVPIPIGEEWFAEPTVARRTDLVTLIGALDYWPNVDAVIWFATDVWPLIRRHASAARLRVVGRRPTAAVRDAVAAAGGELLADVPDVRPHYWEASVVVAPIRLGSGVKNKVLHAAACRAPQVGTTFAFDGTGARDQEVLMADDAEGLARAATACLTDPEAAGRRAAAAVRIATAHRAEQVGGALDTFWERATAAARPTRY